MAHPQLQAVRQRYDFRCGFCGISEVDSGGDLTVDHFQPVSRGGTNDIDNLVYACIRCNQYKGVRQFDETDPQRRLLHPLRDDLSVHIREDETTALLIALTTTGQFHIEALALNRSALVAHRRRRRADALQRTESDEMRLEIAAWRESNDRRVMREQQLEARIRELEGRTDTE